MDVKTAAKGRGLSASEAQPKRPRIDSVDFLRGLVIVVMALDHVRDYVSNVRFDPLDEQQTNLALYFTRWITHFCAPVFLFLAGTSAGFQAQAGKSKRDLSIFLLTRGLWLIFLELTIIYVGWSFNFQPAAFLQVIWAIGVSMIALAALIHAPLWAIVAFGAAMALGHNLLDRFDSIDFSKPESTAPGILWAFLHHMGFFQAGPAPVFIAYPLIPWVGVMALGYAFAEVFRLEAEKRRALVLRIGLVMTAAFFLLRGVNIYGDPQPWAAQESPVKTAMDFFNVNKYPPSLAFLLMTLGPGLIVLSLAERWRGMVYDFFVTFGRVPLFFYIIHIYLAHAIAVALAAAQGLKPEALMVHFLYLPADYGVGLPGVYATWLFVIAALYPLCRWFAGVKRRSKAWWLSYF